MKFVLKTLTLSLFLLLAGRAMGEDYLTASFICSSDGTSWRMPLRLVNSGSYVTFQMDIDLPDSVRVDTIMPNTARLAAPFVLDYNVVDQADNIVRIVGYNLNNDIITGISGDSILTVKLSRISSSGTVVPVDTMTARLTNIQFVNSGDLSWVELPGIVKTEDQLVSSILATSEAAEWLMPLRLINTGSYVAFQMDIDLPADVAVESVVPNTERLSPFICDCNVVDSIRNIVRLVAYNMGNNKIVGASGDSIMTLKLKTAATIAKDTLQAITVSDVQFVRSEDLSWTYLSWQMEGGPNEPTAINQMSGCKANAGRAVYDINGNRIGLPKKGLNIIRHQDGTVQKVLIY